MDENGLVVVGFDPSPFGSLVPPEDLVGRGILGVKALSRRRQSQFSSLHHRVRRSRSEAAKAASEATAMASKLGPAFHTQPPSIYTFSNDTGKLKKPPTFLNL